MIYWVSHNFTYNLVKIKIGYILLIALGTFLSTYVWRNLIIVNARNLECHLREKLYIHFQKLSPEFYNKRKTGDLIAYPINDISAVRMTFGPSNSYDNKWNCLSVAFQYILCQKL